MPKPITFSASASYSPPSKPIVISLGKREKRNLVKAGIAAAMKVRHNKTITPPSNSSFVMISGVPHKLKNGKLVKFVPAAKSKKWDVIEVKSTNKRK